jgi:hypothetical protein
LTPQIIETATNIGSIIIAVMIGKLVDRSRIPASDNGSFGHDVKRAIARL